MTQQAEIGKVLIVGGSGFLSGTLARTAVAQGYSVWTVTRGRRPLLEGVAGLFADRQHRAAFEAAVIGADTQWDLVVDCIGFETAAIQSSSPDSGPGKPFSWLGEGTFCSNLSLPGIWLS